VTGTNEPYEGKAKRMIPRSEREIAMCFKDDATAFNGKKHATFEGKGELNSRISELMLRELARRGIRNNYLSRLDERTLLVVRCRMFALETVVRFKVAGSLRARTGLPERHPCDPPVVELYYKRDDLGDPLLNDDHVRLLGVATAAETGEVKAVSLAAALAVRDVCRRASLDLVDLKFEFGRAPDGRILLVDEISPDTCRFRDAGTGRILDKDLFRRDLGDLMAAYREVHGRLAEALRDA